MREESDITRKRGRGAQINTANPFLKHCTEIEEEYLEYCRLEEEEIQSNKTRYIEVHPKSIINRVDSPDIGFNWSINPYQGCEHGCVYCYARNTHEYWGYSAGTDFEQTILVKKNAPELLLKKLSQKSWKPETIVFSGNTDCYQPAEKKFELTRQMLQIADNCNHPVGLITKNVLILRDLDILKSLNRKGLVRVTLSITSLNEELRRSLEPRTSSVKNRLKALEVLTEAGIETHVNFAPIIPGLNSHEIFELAKECAKRGAVSAGYIMVRLNGRIGEVFEDWVRKEYGERSDKVLNHIRETHGGTLNESRWKIRMKGEGHYAEQIANTFKIACNEYGLSSKRLLPMRTDLFIRPSGNQISLF